MKKILLLTLSILSNHIFSQDSLSVLFIGNSYTYVNDLPTVVNNLTTSLGDKLTVDSRTQGGATFANHVSNASTYTSIHSKPWDFVVIQGQSQELAFPTSQVNSDSEPYIEILADSIHASKYCSQVMIYMTWGRQVGDPQWDSISTYNGMQERLTNTAVRMADSIDASVSAAGVAWKYVRDNYPSINLYSGDGSHPSFEGTYLTACTFYCSLFRKSSVGASYIGTLDATTAGILQAAADLTVLDSLERWNLHALSDQTIADFTYTINASNVSFNNTSIHGTTYHWDFGDGQVSTEENPIHSYLLNNTYDVQLIATDSCDSDTTTYQVVINNLGIHSLSNDNFVFKNLNNNQYKIENKLKEEVEISIINMNGKQMNSSILNQNDIIDLNTFDKGIYLIKIQNNSTLHSYKVVKN